MKKRRIAVICLAASVVVAIGVRLALPAMLVAVANKQFSKCLTLPVKLNAVHLGVLAGRVTFEDLAVRQPDGFGGDLLLKTPEVEVKVAGWSLLGSALTVDEVIVTDLTVHLVRDKEGKVNLAGLLRPQKWNSKPIHFKKITVRNSTVQYTDFAAGNEPLDVTIAPFDGVITDVYLDPARSTEHSLPGRAEVTARIVQPGFSDALLGIVARFGYIDPDQPVPPTNAAIRLGGLELQPLHAVVPPGMPREIGGDVMDVNLDVAMTAEMLDCTVAIVTPAGDSVSLKVGGTPRQPVVDEDRMRSMRGDRTDEAGLNALRNVGGTGKELGGTAFSSVAAVGKGTGKMVGGFVIGLFKTVSSVSQGHMSGAGTGLRDTTWATVTDTAGMLGNTVACLAKGARRTGSAVVGGDRDQVWRADVQRRWSQSWEEACKNVQEKPFPLTVPSAAAQGDAKQRARHALLPDQPI
ncbi:MAG: hypothetical protein A3K18_12790 [Lentisphaerae bacterium RIFOXYA12_64_32]|nr:MAG: hypothetical protein A3K18_12790 [Lentisphaerae bacterium RIFOXYA12_64_32]